MIENNQQPFSYTVKTEGGDYPFFYIEQQGIVYISIQSGLQYEQGKWVEIGPYPSSFTIGKYSENGTQIAADYSTQGSEGDFTATSLILSFNLKVDFTQPLPLENISLPDCSYTYFVSDAGGVPTPVTELVLNT
ncbi:MAG TPA: hypothetical protein VF622_12415 [Segetibacter sp.]|jgi:hypothetical protein